MKVTMRTLSAGPTGTLRPGQTYDLPDEEAKQLIAGNYAVPASRGTAAGQAEKAVATERTETTAAVAGTSRQVTPPTARKSGTK